MSSKREEERNEKIIRGLMKLPPNRRCINCNSLGPQYVCINFWTFVCITCSGIHREFTHRVKSVSMSKFTSQEVESLQNGGNQRAKEMFLKDWDFERQRLPSGNNIENIREFIKHVYVDRKYAGGKSSEKPPRDLQGQGRTEAETRRASSYHSYSQSPPYDFQYEERANKKQGFMLKRKPGSDRGMYEGKVSGLYSPGRYSDHMTEEKFTIEGSSSRVSDYSMSSGGDPFRSHPQSPNSLKDSGFNSPTFDSKEIHADGIQQQTGITHREINGDKAAVPNAQRLVPSTTYGASSVAYQNKAAIVPSEKHSISSVDLFQSPAMPSLLDMFQASSTSSASTGNLASTDSSLTSLSFFEENSQNPKDVNLGVTHSEPAPNNVASSNTSLSSLSFFEDIPEKFSTMNIVPAQSESAPNNLVSSHASSMSSLSFFENPQSSSPLNSVAAHSDSVRKDVGWATFDFPEHASTSKIHDGIPMAEHSGTGTSVDKLNSLTASHNTQWPEFLSSTAHGAPPLMSNVQHENLPPALAIASNSQEWRPFNDIDEQASVGHHPDKPSTADHFVASWESEDFNTGISQSTTSFGPVPGLPSRVIDESSAVDHPAISFMGNLHPHFERTTSNPFDIQYDAEFDASNMQFYDMSTLQSALPSTDLPSSFAGAINDSWFLQDAAPPPGGISYMATQAPSSQLPNVQAHGPVASIGGNPFA